jgi:outer membrane protein insertion porin family/translocation and assembly module TamA
VDKQLHEAYVTFVADPGPFRRFDGVSVSGLLEVREPDILRELAFSGGMPYSVSRVDQSQRNVYRLGLFRSVAIVPLPAGPGGEVPLEIRVEEEKKHSVRLGVGYGSEDHLRLQAIWSRRYLFRRPSILNISARYSSLLWSGALEYNQPYFVNRFTTLGVRAGYDREYSVSFVNERISSQVRAGRILGRSFEGFAAYNLEVNRPLDISASMVSDIEATTPGQFYFISGLLLGIKGNTTGNTLNPSEGYAYSLLLEPATHLLGSGVDYLKGYGEVRAYYPVAQPVVAAVRAGAGFIRSSRFTTTIPIFKRFFLGGSNSVRGYPYQGIGPLDAQGNPTGGEYMAIANLEFRFPLYRKLNGVVFVDGGNVYRGSFDFRFSNLRYATGMGLRYNTIIGPVRLDIAFPVEPPEPLDVRRYSVYISLGNAF